MFRFLFHFRWIAAASLLLSAAVVRAENVDLSTVPSRNTVQLTIYNSEDITLVRETRLVTFKKGNNPLQFSWAGTKIDPTSVELKFLSQADKLTVVDTTYPHAKPTMLYWNVNSEHDGEATIQITYFTSGISWSADYVCIANAKEAAMKLDGFVRIKNESGEAYENAQVRLVVGTINLVEKISQLANLPMDQIVTLSFAAKNEYRKQAVTRFFAMPAGAAAGAAPAPMDSAPAAKEVIKEGLSEYFIYTIEGTETIPSGWSKRIRSFEGDNVPFKVHYRYRPREYGDQLVRMYLLTNDEESKLGTTPLPDGVVRVFRDNGKDGLSYLTQQQIKYVPIGDKIELNLGVDPEVIFELVKLRSFRNHLWLQIHGTNEFREIGGDGVMKVENANLVGWDDHEIFTQRIRNYTARPIEVEVRREFGGHVLFRSSLQPKLHDYQTVEFKATVPNGKRQDLKFEVVRHQGTNSKQNIITLEAAEVQ